jgi:hypothetical protein
VWHPSPPSLPGRNGDGLHQRCRAHGNRLGRRGIGLGRHHGDRLGHLNGLLGSVGVRRGPGRRSSTTLHRLGSSEGRFVGSALCTEARQCQGKEGLRMRKHFRGSSTYPERGTMTDLGFWLLNPDAPPWATAVG